MPVSSRAVRFGPADWPLLPAFDPGAPPEPAEASGLPIVKVDMIAEAPSPKFGESSGDTERQFEVIRALAATGAVA